MERGEKSTFAIIYFRIWSHMKDTYSYIFFKNKKIENLQISQ